MLTRRAFFKASPLSEWAPDEATRNRILVQNPEALYGFGKQA